MLSPQPKKKSKTKKTGKQKGKVEPDYYEVEAILEHKIQRAKGGKRDLEVHVKWKGYEETTWESFISFAQDSPEVVKRYFCNLDKKLDHYQDKVKSLININTQLKEQQKKEKISPKVTVAFEKDENEFNLDKTNYTKK